MTTDPDRLADAMQSAWNAWIGDVGHVPDAFTVSPHGIVSALFRGSEFARLVAGRYDVLAARDATAAARRLDELEEAVARLTHERDGYRAELRERDAGGRNHPARSAS